MTQASYAPKTSEAPLPVSNNPSGFQRLPNEILSKILALVPHRPENTRAMCAVSTRFRAVATSSGYRTELVRCQYPEIASLRDIQSVSTEALTRIVSDNVRVQAAVRKMSEAKDSRETIEALTIGVHLLDHISMLTLMDTDGERRARLIIGAKNSGFADNVQLAIRYTIYRTCDTIFPTLTHFLIFLNVPITMEDMRVENDHIGLLNTFYCRAFEIAVLFDNHQCLFSDIVLGNTFTGFNRTAKGQFMTLLRAVRYLDVKELDTLDSEYDAVLAYVQGKKWRMLSPADRDAPPVLGSPEPQNKAIGVPLVTELLLDRKMHQTFEDTSTAGGFRSDCDYKKVGSVLRQAQYLIDLGQSPAKWDREVEENRLLETFE
ncbi:hypothetical protein PMZ80_002866 [Knufia obscura]|uniref:F-box domain-containing protein n=1 Tax=Knufia obscura TaxID=1635080 RepID=A0ABR0RYJ2_9EURO|nr:hypothetical protein PMZ80_002866 [Knufia obscura]